MRSLITRALLRLERTMNLLCHYRGREGGERRGRERKGGEGREGEGGIPVIHILIGMFTHSVHVTSNVIT